MLIQNCHAAATLETTLVSLRKTRRRRTSE